MQQTELLRRVFDAAVAAVAPEQLIPAALAKIKDQGPAVVLGAGKGAAAMAAAFRAAWRGPVRGFVVTRYEHGLKAGEDTGAIEIVEAGHPSPDEASVSAGRKLLEYASNHRSDEQLFFLVSGGGSALAAVPAEGIAFADKRAAANHLMHSGANIAEINCVRKHLSALKGGRLAVAAHPARFTTLAISDVPGDDIADIASGPTIPDPSTQADAIRILQKFAYPKLADLMPVLGNPAFETPGAADPAFENNRFEVIGSASVAMAAAANLLRTEGYEVLELGDDIDEDAQDLARAHAVLAAETLRQGKRTAILSGGETRVTIRNTNGRGGRNLVYLSRLALELDGSAGVFALAADTDGIDGHGGHAGGFVTPGMLELGRERAVDLNRLLSGDDSYTFFDACDLLITTGPTRTNVNDFRLILCHP